MDIHEKFVFTQPIDSLFKAFGNKAGVEKKYTALGRRNINIESCKLTKDTLNLKVTQETPLDAPAALKKFLGDWTESTQEENWTGTPGKEYKGDLNIKLKGVPCTLVGGYLLYPEGKGSIFEVKLSVSCGIPLIGKKLAEFVGTAAQKQMNAEYEYNRDNIK